MEKHSYAPVPLRLAMGVILSVAGYMKLAGDCRHDSLLHEARFSGAGHNSMVHYLARINRRNCADPRAVRPLFFAPRRQAILISKSENRNPKQTAKF